MARPKAHIPGSDAPKAPKTSLYSNIFRSTSQILFFSLFALWIPIAIAECGLVSYLIHKYGRPASDWPGAEYQHAINLGLFSSIVSILFGFFHWGLSLFMFLPIFLAHGVWWGTVAGILEKTPFGHGLQCGNPASSFPTAYVPFLNDCSKVTAIEGLAWAMFGLSVIGFFLTVFTKFDFTSVRNVVYDLEMTAEQKDARGFNEKRAEEGSNHSSA